jgi:hypothetical protein
MMTPRDPTYAGLRQFANPFHRHSEHDTAANFRSGRAQTFATWADVTGVAMGQTTPIAGIAQPIARYVNL